MSDKTKTIIDVVGFYVASAVLLLIFHGPNWFTNWLEASFVH